MRTDAARLRHAPIERVPAPALVFLPDRSGHLLLSWVTSRNVSLRQPVLWAVDRGPAANARVLEAFPGRAPFVLDLGARPELRRLTVRDGERLQLRVVTPTKRANAVLEVEWRGVRYRAHLLAGTFDVALDETSASGSWAHVAPAPGSPGAELVVRLLAPNETGRLEELATTALPVTSRSGRLTALVPTRPPKSPEPLEIVAAPAGDGIG